MTADRRQSAAISDRDHRMYRTRRRDFLGGLGLGLAARAVRAQGLLPSFGSASFNRLQAGAPAAYDVVIYGATVAGIGAAYTARSMGKKVLLIQHDWFGGMTGAGGLTNLDLYYPNVQGGIWWQMFQRMALTEGVATPGWPTTAPASSLPGNPGYVNPAIPAGEWLRSFAIITTTPNELCAELHNRMPVVLKPEAWPVWLGEEAVDPSELKSLMAPFPSEEMTCWPVSARVGNVKNNDPNLIEPIAA